MNHAYELAAPGAPEEWEHTVVGDGDDAGLVFVYRWETLVDRASALGCRRPDRRHVERSSDGRTSAA